MMILPIYSLGHVKSEDITADIWVDSVSLQPFTQEEWTPHHKQSLNMKRKGSLRTPLSQYQTQPSPQYKTEEFFTPRDIFSLSNYPIGTLSG